MQIVNAALQAELDKGLTDPVVLVDLVEWYESSYVPGVNGFDPADAVEKFASQTITWNGIAYRRGLESHGDISKNMGEKTNSTSFVFSNIDRYPATFAQSQPVEGLYAVVRTVAPSVITDSLVPFVGRNDKPGDIDKKSFPLSARQDFANINQEIPPRLFTAEDPNGRTPSDLLYEGFRILPLMGNFSIPVTTASTSFFGRLFGKKKTTNETRQWSSLDATPYGSVVPMHFGRVQVEGIPLFFSDIGYSLVGLWAWGEGRVDRITNVVVRDENLTLATQRDAFGDPGGTLTNLDAINPSDYPQGAIAHGYLSKTAYTVLSIRGSAGDVVDEAPLVTSLIRGLRIPVPNSSGVYASSAWSDNPVNVARFILTDTRLVGINSGFMEDSVNYLTSLHCDEPLIDDSNGEVSLITSTDQPQGGTNIRRFRSTGVITPRWILYNYLGDVSIIPEEVDNTYTAFSPTSIPSTFAINRLLRRRYVVNFPLTERVRAVDCLYKTVNPAAKLFYRVNKRGKYEIRSEKSADSSHLRAATAVDATSLLIKDVTPWKTGPDLLTGRLLTGFGLTTSEVRNVSSATYTADGNAVTLAASVTGGGVTATASGANLTLGSTTVQASGTVTIGGTPAAGNTATITIDGIASTHTLNADDTTGTVAAMLSALINANLKLNKYIKATWLAASPTIVTIQSKQGVLNLDSALLKAHTGPIADPTTTPVLLSSAGALGAGTMEVAYSDKTALGRTALSPVASIVITASKQIDVGAIALVGTSRDWYTSDAPNSPYLKWVANTNGAAFSINALPLPGAAMPPSFNTTGEELLRIAMSFATNSQDVYSAWPASTLILLGDIYLPTVLNGHKYEVTTGGTTGATEPTWPTTAGGTVASGTAVFTEVGSTVLQQAGLTRANILANTFKWPLGSKQSSVNQIKGNYRDANNDFALTPFKVNDRIHQLQVGKIYPLEVDLSAVDNWHQAFRIAKGLLAKFREGDWFCSLGAGPQALVLEEGDLICVSDDSGGLINVVTRIEDLRIKPNHTVDITQARKYSTGMFADEVEADVIPVPTTLRYTQTAPSIVEFIDNYPIRDSDGLTSGFYVAVSRDLSVLGDWRGWELYADYGDGYVAIPGASGSLPAIVGNATTILGAVTDATAFDTAKTFTADATTDFLTFADVPADGSSVHVSNSGGALPAPLVAGTTYFITGKVGNTAKLAATSGGAVIDLTTNGTGTNSIKNVLTLTLKYGPPPPLAALFSTVTQADLIANPHRNFFLYGSEYIQAATVVSSGTLSYTLSDFYRGRFETEPTELTHSASERVIYLDGSEVFVPTDESRIGIEYSYKAVTTNQNVSEATPVLFTWLGKLLADKKVTDLTASRDASGNWHASAVGHPRQLPAFYNLRVRRPVDDVLMRDIPIATGITQSGVFGDTFGNVLVTNNDLAAGTTKTFTAVAATDVITVVGNNFPDGHKVRVSNTGGALPAPLVIDTDYFIRDKVGDTAKLAATLAGAAIDLTTDGTGTNSIRTAPFVVSGARMTQEITEPGAFIEFVLPALSTLAGGSLNLAFFHSADAGWTDTSAWTLGVYTVRMTVNNVTTGEWAISVWDVGGESAGQPLASSLVVGLGAMKLRLTFSGTELRIYKDWANTSTTPLVISKVPPADHFPMKAAFYLITGAVNNDAARIEDVAIGGMVNPSTVYSLAQQERDLLANGASAPVAALGLPSVDLEMWQVSTVEGRKVRAEFP